MLPAIGFRRGKLQLPSSGFLAQRWGAADGFCSGKPRAALAAPGCPRTRSAPHSPALCHPPGRFGKRMPLPQRAVTAPAVRTGTANTAVQHPTSATGRKHPCSWSPSRGHLSYCHGKGLRAERSDRTLPRASQSHCKGSRREGRSDGWPEEPSKTQGRVRKCITKYQGRGRRYSMVRSRLGAR